MGKLSSALAFSGLALCIPALAGCPSPNTYGSPRTIAPGKLQHTVALEGVAVAGGGASGVAPNLPTYQLRVGLADTVDLSARIANLSSIGLDVKWNFLKSRVDLALDPGFNTSYVSANGASAFVLYGHLPLLVGINVSDWFTVHLTPGMMATYASATVPTDDKGSLASSGSGLAVRAGLGLNFRVSDGFAITPEATFLRPLTDDAGNIIIFGLGFSFGTMPDYKDMM